MHEQLRGIPFELKQLSETGEFEGIASVFGNVDLGGDVVDETAFDKTIAQRGNKVRLMDGHRIRIGVATLQKSAIGLKTVGKINLSKQSGMEAYSDLKFYEENGLPMGMSIGYETINAIPASKSVDGARHLTEVRLWEVTVTEFPMNERAQVLAVKSVVDLIASVKAARATEAKDDFTSELQEIQVYAARYQMIEALSSALCDIIYDSEVVDKVVASRDSIQQFTDAYLGMLPDYLDLMSSESMRWMTHPGFEKKAGRVLSQSNRDLIARVVTDLQALLDTTDTADSNAKAVAVPSETAVSGPPPGAATQSEPDDRHSAIDHLFDEMRSLIPA